MRFFFPVDNLCPPDPHPLPTPPTFLPNAQKTVKKKKAKGGTGECGKEGRGWRKRDREMETRGAGKKKGTRGEQEERERGHDGIAAVDKRDSKGTRDKGGMRRIGKRQRRRWAMVGEERKGMEKRKEGKGQREEGQKKEGRGQGRAKTGDKNGDKGRKGWGQKEDKGATTGRKKRTLRAENRDKKGDKVAKNRSMRGQTVPSLNPSLP